MYTALISGDKNMILARMAGAIKRQDWFQVIIEIMIVVIGIYLGFQVTEWGEEREAENQERIYLEQIRAEIIDTLPLAQRRFEENDELRKKVHDVTYYVSGTAGDISLTDDHCVAINRSHNIVNNAPVLTSLAELVNGGQLANLENEQLKNLIARYMRASAADELRFLNRDRNARRLSTNYPGMIKVTGKIRADDVASNPTASVTANNEYHCDYQAMKQNDAFINDLIVNDLESIANARGSYSQLQLLIELLDELGKELGVSNEGGTE